MIPGFVIWSAVALMLVGVGVWALRSMKAVGFFAGVEAPKVTDVRKYNRAVAGLWFKPLGGSSEPAPAASPFKPIGNNAAPASRADRVSARPPKSQQPAGNPNFQSPFSAPAQNVKTTEDGTVLKPMTAESLAHIDDLKPVRSVVSSPEEEVEKYRRLLSIGAITADEFELKKRQLIGD
ncbi:MAG: SHOCT domain-containing protein [Clostridiales bacterium]|nr:SHOCT domain-containing protein [Clostridiales bacterium]